MKVDPKSVSISLAEGGSQIISKTVSGIVVTPVVVEASDGLSVAFSPPEQAANNGGASFEEKLSVASTVLPGSTLKALVDFQVGRMSVGAIQKVQVDVPKHDTALAVSDVSLIVDQPGTLTATLTDTTANPNAPIGGASIQFSMPAGFTLDNGGRATTDKNGVATCGVTATSSAPLGNSTIAASYAGDAHYNGSEGTGTATVGAFLGAGYYVIGDTNAVVGSNVTFWGADWAKVNTLSNDSSPPNRFKGYATTSSSPTCGGSWSGPSGNSAKDRPTNVHSYMGVLATSKITESGPMNDGDIVKVAIVQVITSPGTGAGQDGTGTVVGIVCCTS